MGPGWVRRYLYRASARRCTRRNLFPLVEAARISVSGQIDPVPNFGFNAPDTEIADLAAVEALGVLPEHYAGLDYGRTQEIGDAANFLGFDGILTPSARWAGQNLLLFTNRFDPDDLVVAEQETVDWAEYKRVRKSSL